MLGAAGDAPSMKFFFGQALDVGRPLDEHRQIAGMAHVGSGMAGMIDGGDDEAGIGERLGHIVMADEIAACAMRDDDERQLVAADRTVFYPA
jgi:hypothetical protein